MTALYLLFSVFFAGILFVNRNELVNKIFVRLFLLLQIMFTLYEFTIKGEVDFQYFRPDALALLLLGTLTIITIPALLHSYDYIYREKDNPRTRGIYYGAMVLLIMALSAAYLSSHIAVTWIFVEITTLSSSALIFHRRNAGSVEATWKYIFVCSVSLAIVFIGILFLTLAIGKGNDESLYYQNLRDLAPRLNTEWLKLAFLFIFSGFTVKLGLLPMFTAGIDAKDKAPTPAGALFSSVLMNVGFIGIFRFYEVVAQTSIRNWSNLIMMIAAILSVFIAAVYMLKVKNIKRMLAYSSIEHMGIVMIGLSAGGIGYYAAILHLILHSFAKSSFFLQIGHLYKTYKTKNIDDIGNYFNLHISGGVFMILAFICITAMPPSGLFISEFYVIRALFEAGNFWVLVPLLILLTTIIWALGNNIFRMLFSSASGKLSSEPEKINRDETIMQYVLLGLVVYLGIFPPDFFVDLITEAVSHLMH